MFLQEKTREKQLMWTRTGNIFYQAPESFEITGYDEKGNFLMTCLKWIFGHQALCFTR